jgi:hypothetical protein
MNEGLADLLVEASCADVEVASVAGLGRGTPVIALPERQRAQREVGADEIDFDLLAKSNSVSRFLILVSILGSPRRHSTPPTRSTSL